MIGPLIATKGYGAPEVADITARALDPCRKREQTPGGFERVFPILYCEWSHKQVTGQVRQAFDLAKGMLAHAEAQPASGPKVIARRLMGTSLLLVGQPANARVNLEAAVALYDAKEHAALAYLYGTDFGITEQMPSRSRAVEPGIPGAVDDDRRRGAKGSAGVRPRQHAGLRVRPICSSCVRCAATSRAWRCWPNRSSNSRRSASCRSGARSRRGSSAGTRSRRATRSTASRCCRAASRSCTG